MDEKQLLALIQYLGKYGMSEKDIMALFGGQFGLSPEQVDTSGLFAQYMPTFAQINQYDKPDSIRQSIAKEIMSGTPIWQVQQGIQNAIANGDAGVEPGQTLQDYVSLAKTLEGEFQSYNKALNTARANTTAAKYGITASPQDTYTDEQIAAMFPGAMEELAKIYKERPVNTTMDQSLAARYAASPNQPASSGSTVKSDLDAARKALKSNVQSYTYNGKEYSLGELRDELIPILAKRKSNEDKMLKSQREAREGMISYAKEGSNVAGRRFDKARTDLAQEEQDWKVAQQNFQKGKITEQQLRRAQIEWAAANETAARLAGEVSQRKSSVSAAESPKMAPTTSASGVPIAPKNFGPGSAVSARTTKTDPFALDVTQGVMEGIKNKLAQSGRSPYWDQIKNLVMLQKVSSGK